MSSSALPDFEHTLQLSQGNLDAAELAECHGALCGMICGEADCNANDYIQLLAALQLMVDPGSGLTSSMIDAFDITRQQLDDEELGFRLWLPADEQPLEERTIALSQWCTGFLAGLGASEQLGNLSEESSEALEDLQQIARAAFVGDVDSDDENSEQSDEEEMAFMEIVEYVRVVTLMMREEFRGPGRHDAIH